jgi:hypothetical protein
MRDYEQNFTEAERALFRALGFERMACDLTVGGVSPPMIWEQAMRHCFMQGISDARAAVVRRALEHMGTGGFRGCPEFDALLKFRPEDDVTSGEQDPYVADLIRAAAEAEDVLSPEELDELDRAATERAREEKHEERDLHPHS